MTEEAQIGYASWHRGATLLLALDFDLPSRDGHVSGPTKEMSTEHRLCGIEAQKGTRPLAFKSRLKSQCHRPAVAGVCVCVCVPDQRRMNDATMDELKPISHALLFFPSFG